MTVLQYVLNVCTAAVYFAALIGPVLNRIAVLYSDVTQEQLPEKVKAALGNEVKYLSSMIHAAVERPPPRVGNEGGGEVLARFHWA